MMRRRKPSPLVPQLLLFVAVTTLSVATGFLTNQAGSDSGPIGFIRRSSAGLAVAVFIVAVILIFWQHRTEARLNSRDQKWTGERSPYPGLESFTEDDSTVFFGRQEI